GTFIPDAFIADIERPDLDIAFSNATYSAAPGTSLATHIDPFVAMVRSFIIAAASGGTWEPVISDRDMGVVKLYSSHLTPSMIWDLPVGVTAASSFTGDAPAAAVVVDAAVSIATTRAVFGSWRRPIIFF